jgi:hypothetical protein
MITTSFADARAFPAAQAAHLATKAETYALGESIAALASVSTRLPTSCS